MKIKIIQNPSSGRIGFEDEFQDMCSLLLNRSHQIQLFKTKGKHDAYNETVKAIEEGFELIVVSGGDGTVNEIAKALFDSKTTVAMAIFKTGTVNDFANHLKLPITANEFVKMIDKNICIPVDIGRVNGEIFVNIAAAGLFTSIAHETKKEVKALLGRSAYYLEAILSLPRNINMTYNLSVESKEYNKSGEYHLFLITNSKSVGGFDKISPIAEIQDGYFDCMFIRKAPIVKQAEIFMQILLGKHLDNKFIDYFRTKKIKIELEDNKKLVLDIDGEDGGSFPVNIEVLPLAINVLVNE